MEIGNESVENLQLSLSVLVYYIKLCQQSTLFPIMFEYKLNLKCSPRLDTVPDTSLQPNMSLMFDGI